MFVPDRQAMLGEARRVLVEGGILLFSVWDRVEENPHALASAEVIEAMFPGDAEMRFRIPYEMHEPALLLQLLAGARFRDARIETKRIAFAGVDPRNIATGQIRGTPRSTLIEKRGVALELVIDKVAAALASRGGNPYRGHAQGLIVEAQAG
jgi:SAM-dependent methyltransferase